MYVYTYIYIYIYIYIHTHIRINKKAMLTLDPNFDGRINFPALETPLLCRSIVCCGTVCYIHMCVYVCIYIYIHVHTHIYIYTHTYT